MRLPFSVWNFHFRTNISIFGGVEGGEGGQLPRIKKICLPQAVIKFAEPPWSKAK